MKQLYKTIKKELKIYLPLRFNRDFMSCNLYAYNDLNIIRLLAFNPYYDTIIYSYDDKYEYEFMSINEFIDKQYSFLYNPKDYFKQKMKLIDLPF